MEKISLCVADTDKEYIHLLMEYIRSSKWNDRFAVKMFTFKESLLQDLKSGSAAQLYLVHPDLMPERRWSGCWLLLTDTNKPTDQADGFVFKYQPLDRLLQSAVEHLASSGKRRRGADQGRPSVISIHSATGGAGKSTVAVHLLKQLAGQGSRCLLLSLETLCTLVPPDRGYSNAFSQLLYYVRSGSVEAVEHMKPVIRQCPHVQADFIGGDTSLREMEEMTAQDVSALLELASRLDKYDVIVIDTDSSVQQRVLGALQSSDRIVWIIRNEAGCLKKTELFWNACPQWLTEDPELLRSKLLVALNGWKGEMLLAEVLSGFRNPVKLPYISRWKSVQAWEEIKEEPLFDHALAQLIAGLGLESGVMRLAARHHFPVASGANPGQTGSRPPDLR